MTQKTRIHRIFTRLVEARQRQVNAYLKNHMADLDMTDHERKTGHRHTRVPFDF